MPPIMRRMMNAFRIPPAAPAFSASLPTLTTSTSTQQRDSRPTTTLPPPSRRNRRRGSEHGGDAATPHSIPFSLSTTQELSISTTATSHNGDQTVATVTLGISHGKTSKLEIPDLPTWAVYFLFVALVMGFVLAGLLGLAMFPPVDRYFSNLPFPALRSKLGWVFWRSYYHPLDSSSDGEQYEAGERDEEVDEYEYITRLNHFHSHCTTTGSTNNSPMESQSIRQRNVKKSARNIKDLSVNTNTTYSGLSVAVRRALDYTSSQSSSAFASASSELSNAREFLTGSREDEVILGEERDDTLWESFAAGLDRLSGGIENAAGWVAGVLHRDVPVGGAEEGLLLGVQECEREGFVGEDGVAVGDSERMEV